jgi:alpha-1,6-mannosyltransferase
LKLCDVTQFYSPFSGGVKRYLHEKIGYIQGAREHEHVLIVPGPRNACTTSERSRIYTIHSPIVSRPSGYRALLDLRAMEEIIERERPHLIESGDPYQIAWRLIRVRNFPIPVIGFYHSHFAEAHLRGSLGRALAYLGQRYVRSLYNRFAATLVPSRGLAAVLNSWGVRNVRLASLGVNTDVFSPCSDQGHRIRARLGLPARSTLLLYIGRLSREKNTRTLFRAFEELNASAPGKFQLLVIGDGPERKELGELQAKCPSVRWIRYCAEPAELARYYRAADLFVHPGTHETFGLAALESQACGTPVVGIRGSFMDEVILHDQTCWAQENVPELLARAIVCACASDLRAEGKRAAALVVEKFSWPHVFEQLFYIYEEVCSNYGKQ